jgi:hypothetical protein
MSDLSQSDRRELERLLRRVAHVEQTYLDGLRRVYGTVPRELATGAEQLLGLEDGALAAWLVEREHTPDAPLPLPVRLVVFELVDHDTHANGNGRTPGDEQR